MSRIDRARYSMGKSLMAILVSSTIMTFVIFGYIQIDTTNFTVGLLQIIGLSILEAMVLGLVVVLLFGRKPKK